MTRDDALLHFPFEEDDDLDDLFEERLFEFKQKLMLLASSRKLFDIHLNRFEKVSKAYLFLSGESEEFVGVDFQLQSFNEDLSVAWNKFNENKNQLKLLLSQAKTLTSIREVLDYVLVNSMAYADLFVELDLDGHDQKVIGKEPDPMELSLAIKQFNDRGFHKISEITKLDSNNILYQEANRLSLWSKKEKNVG